MDVFSKLFGNFIAFVYHCFDRIVIHGYLSGLSRPEQVVHFFRRIVGVPVLSKEILSERTANYQNWVEAFARNHRVPIEWAEKGVRKEDYVLRWLRRMIRTNRYGVYFIFKSMEQGRTFRISTPKYPTQDPNYRILAHQRSRFTHYYFYIRDEVLGPHGDAGGLVLPLPNDLLPQWSQLHRAGAQPRTGRLPQARQCIPGDRRCRCVASRCRQIESANHRQTARLLDLPAGAEVLRQGAKADQPVALLCHLADRVLPQLHLQAQLAHPQAVRAQLRTRPVAAHRRQDCRDLRHPSASQDARQARHHHRSDRAWPSCLSRLLQARLPQAIREVLNVPAQRTVFQQPRRFRSAKRLGPSR